MKILKENVYTREKIIKEHVKNFQVLIITKELTLSVRNARQRHLLPNLKNQRNEAQM